MLSIYKHFKGELCDEEVINDYFICILSVSVDTAFSEDFAVLKLARITVPVGMPDMKAQKFAELIGEKSGGRVKIEIYPAQQLGNIKKILQGRSMGTIDIVQEAESFMDTFDKDCPIFGTPFMFSP